MRMLHYYAALAFTLVPALVITLALGVTFDGSQSHLIMGFLTAILCVATHTLFTMFMIITGRVLKAAMKARPLDAKYLDEFNEFFRTKRAYPMALGAAALTVGTAVLGYGRFIGVPTWVHMLLGLTTVIFNILAVQVSVRTLRKNQELLDLTTDELDRIDREIGPAPDDAGDVEWRFPATTRWLVFGISSWLPYLYWGLVVWGGDFGRIPTPFVLGTAIASGGALLFAWLLRRNRLESV